METVIQVNSNSDLIKLTNTYCTHQGVVYVLLCLIIRVCRVLVAQSAVASHYEVALNGLHQCQGVDLDRAALPLTQRAA